jgi:putative transposase
LGYSKQAFHKREAKAESKADYKANSEQEVLSSVAEIRADMPRVGTRKLYYLLSKKFEDGGIKVGRDKLFSILKSSNLLIVKRKRYVRTTDSSSWLRQHENLVEDFVPEKPEELLVSDITYFETEVGNVYGQLVTDGYSKKIMGYEAAYDMKKERTIIAFDMAMSNRIYDHGGIHHSDRGLQYCSPVYTTHVQDNKYEISMTQDGSPYDNAVAERINGILKDEFGLGEKMKNLEEVKARLQRAVEIYNDKRPHFSCHLLTPNQMHQQQKLKIVTWRKKIKTPSDESILNNPTSSNDD